MRKLDPTSNKNMNFYEAIRHSYTANNVNHTHGGVDGHMVCSPKNFEGVRPYEEEDNVCFCDEKQKTMSKGQV